VIIPIIAIQRLDSVWSDPDSFKPERWLEDLPSSEKLQYGWSSLLAFSDGPRACIGFRLGEPSAYCVLFDTQVEERYSKAIYNYKVSQLLLVRAHLLTMRFRR
jgi:hypothetical protein